MNLLNQLKDEESKRIEDLLKNYNKSGITIYLNAYADGLEYASKINEARGIVSNPNNIQLN